MPAPTPAPAPAPTPAPAPAPAPAPERKKFRHRPQPLFIPPPSLHPGPASHSGATLYQSQLRSPRVLGDHLLLDPAHELPPYTPPPMLSPVRQGSGLFSNVLIAGHPGAHAQLPLTPLTPTPRVLLCRSSESPLRRLGDPGGFAPPVLGIALGGGSHLSCGCPFAPRTCVARLLRGPGKVLVARNTYKRVQPLLTGEPRLARGKQRG